MALTREKKEQILKELKEIIKKANFIIFVNFHGLSVSSACEIRNLMKRNKMRYLVAKKTLIKKALESSGLKKDRLDLKGEVALIFGEVKDPSIATKVLLSFSKEHKKVLTPLGGVFENELVDKSVILKLSQLPSREVLTARFINILNAPMRQMVGVLAAPLRDFIVVLKGITKFSETQKT
jgi:large subunit ribosomal protein L10